MSLVALTLLVLAPLQGQLGLYKEESPVPVPSTLWVVDASGGGDFTTIQPAIDAARSGDAIEVRPGVYAGFTWESKDLIVFGSGSPRPTIRNAVLIRSIGALQSAVLRNLDFRLVNNANPALVTLQSSAGTVWLEDCTFAGKSVSSAADGELRSIECVDCENVVVQGCTVSAEGRPDNPFFPYGPRAAFRAIRSSVQAYQSEFIGPRGHATMPSNPFTTWPTNQEGGRGMELEDSQLFAAGCSFAGGAPSQTAWCWPMFPNFFQCVTPKPGGTALVVDAGSTAESLDSTLTPGPGQVGGIFLNPCYGTPAPFPCPDGPAGEPFSGTVTITPIPAFAYRIDAPAAAGGTYHLSVEGQPGWFVFSVFSDRPDGVSFPLYFGVRLTAPPMTFIDEGTIPAGGVLEKDVPVPPAMLGEPFLARFAQGLLFDELANAFLTGGSVLIVR